MKDRQREVRDGFPEGLGLRTHRALSWLQRAEQEADDEDARFIFLWISFNAAYAQEIEDPSEHREHRVQQDFLQRLVDCDQHGLLYELVWEQFSGPIRLLLDNEYVFQPFWKYQNGLLSEDNWRERFETSKAAARRALKDVDTVKILAITFDRLYVLRNQLVHGGATWNSGVNREQVRDGANILGEMVPTIIYLMMGAPEEGLGASLLSCGGLNI